MHAIARLGILAALPAWPMHIVQLRSLHGRGGLRSSAEFTPTDDEAMLLTGLIYRIAEIAGENPAMAVAESIGLKQRTATNWIQRARAAGYMTSTEHGRAAKRVATMITPFWVEYLKDDWKEWLDRKGLTGDAIREAFWREHARLAEEEG